MGDDDYYVDDSGFLTKKPTTPEPHISASIGKGRKGKSLFEMFVKRDPDNKTDAKARTHNECPYCRASVKAKDMHKHISKKHKNRKQPL